jgi:hypothetical protein
MNSVFSVANPNFCFLIFAFYFVALDWLSNYNFLCKTNPIFSHVKINVSLFFRRTNNYSLTTGDYKNEPKRTQLNPIQSQFPLFPGPSQALKICVEKELPAGIISRFTNMEQRQ